MSRWRETDYTRTSDRKACATQHRIGAARRGGQGMRIPSNSKRRGSMRDTVTQTEIRHARRTERTDGRRWGWEGVTRGLNRVDRRRQRERAWRGGGRDGAYIVRVDCGSCSLPRGLRLPMSTRMETRTRTAVEVLFSFLPLFFVADHRRTRKHAHALAWWTREAEW